MFQNEVKKEKNKITIIKTFVSPEGIPGSDESGVHRYEQIKEKLEGALCVTYKKFDLDGKIIGKIRTEKSQKDIEVIIETVVNPDETPCCDEYGIHKYEKVTSRPDDFLTLTVSKVYDIAGHLVVHPEVNEGFAIHKELSSGYHILREEFFDEHENRMCDKDGIARYEFKYNNDSIKGPYVLKIKSEYFGKNDEPVLNKEGYAKRVVVYKNNFSGIPVDERFYDAEGKLIKRIYGEQPDRTPFNASSIFDYD